MFESYIDDKIKSLKKIKKIVDFIDKYDMEYFVIAMEMEEDNYMFEDIRKQDGVYSLEYIDYNNVSNPSNAKGRLVDLLSLSDEIVDSLYRCCDEYGRFEVEFHLEMDSDTDEFINILKKYKKEIKFTDVMFINFLDNDLQDEINEFKFQDVLFSTHPESYKKFINVCFDNLNDNLSFKLHPKILKKYKGLLGKYYDKKDMEYNSSKYNI